MMRLMVYPSDDEAWKRFNSVHPNFSAESRNVRLGLCIDGFNLFGSFAAPYSCWSVILTIYNLLPGMCMREVDYYGRLEEVVELQYHSEQNKVFLFKCYWYDTTDRGIRVDTHHGLVEINSKARLRNRNDVFVFAK